MKRKGKAKLQTWREGMADWLGSLDWTFFATFTTPYEMSTASARRLMERTHDSWTRLTDGQCTVIYFMEPNELRDGYHLHALVKVPPVFTHATLFGALCDSYKAMAGGTVVKNDHGKLTFSGGARIQLKPYNPKRRSGAYVTKYITKKNGPDHWDLLLPKG